MKLTSSDDNEDPLQATMMETTNDGASPHARHQLQGGIVSSCPVQSLHEQHEAGPQQQAQKQHTHGDAHARPCNGNTQHPLIRTDNTFVLWLGEKRVD